MLWREGEKGAIKDSYSQPEMMQPVSQSAEKHLVLIGGGHSHAIALKLFGEKLLSGARLTLISNTDRAPYSGMLPGYVAGFYEFEECHVDLVSLARFAGAELLLDRAIALDLENNKVLLASGSSVGFDFLSIDIGSTPATLSVPGAAEYAIPAKPVLQLLANWSELVEVVRERARSQNQAPLRLGIVGGGAGGVELALAMQARLSKIIADAQMPAECLEFHLFHRSAEIATGHNRNTRRILQELLVRRGVKLHLKEAVREVLPLEGGATCARCESGLSVECDRLFWVTQASAASWLREAGLATDDAGFILVGDTLQSVSHPNIFAAGDVATMRDRPRPKAGVFAVRQGKPLFENLRRAVEGKPLKSFVPQEKYLALIGTGEGEAIASRGDWACGASPMLWYWKDWIDRRFMAQFENLPQKRH